MLINATLLFKCPVYVIFSIVLLNEEKLAFTTRYIQSVQLENPKHLEDRVAYVWEVIIVATENKQITFSS